MGTMPMPWAMMADLALRLDVTGRRIVVLAGPGDRRDEDLGGDRERGRGTLRSLHLPARRQSARPRAGRGAAHPSAALRAAGSARQSRSRSFRTNKRPSMRPCAWGEPGDLLLDFRRCVGAIVETDHQVQAERRCSDREGRPLCAAPAPRCVPEPLPSRRPTGRRPARNVELGCDPHRRDAAAGRRISASKE